MKHLAAFDIILAPVITEKSTALSDIQGSKITQVVFQVKDTATKPDIKAAVEKLFNVKVRAVNTLVRKGKAKVFRGRRGRQSDVKNAIVTLEPGFSIDVSTGL
jgi:large subunit ribosomal protein L23